MPKRTIALAQVEARSLSESAVALDEALDAVARAGDAGADLCVLPEGTYPGYVLGSRRAGLEAVAVGPEPIATFGRAAADAGLELIVGLVLVSDGRLHNSAVHFGPDGSVLNRVSKQFLWHFDHAWFEAGEAADVVSGVGILVCADGRLPEISAGLVRAGAGLLVNSTAWVVARPAPTGTNAQAEFLWRVRALESGAAAAACTKVGTEGAVAMYSGRSQVIAADGSPVAIASATDAELLVCDVDVPVSPHPPVERPTNLSAPREPSPQHGHAYVVVLTDRDLISAVETHGCRLLVTSEGVEHVEALAVATLHDDDLLVPGPCRQAAFGGAEVVVWLARDVSSPFVEPLARARALENRVFVVVWRCANDGGPFVVDPDGAVIASAPPGRRHAVGVSILPAAAASKEVAPGSDLFAGAARALAEDG